MQEDEQTISPCLRAYSTVTQGRQTFNLRRGGLAASPASDPKRCLAQMNGKTSHVCETSLLSVVKAELGI